MDIKEVETNVRNLAEHAWDREVTWPQINAWTANFTGVTAASQVERDHCLVALSRFMYFSKRLIREMLKSLYRDYFEAPLIQRIRRNYGNTRDEGLLRSLYDRELQSTRFIGIGNPSESGAHLLYYFRQVNHLPKKLFVDIGSAFIDPYPKGKPSVTAADPTVSRYVFFDDIVGSADQCSGYLGNRLRLIRAGLPSVDLRFMSLFATTAGLARLNDTALFGGKAMCLFELDESFRAFHPNQRYFPAVSDWFSLPQLEAIARQYGSILMPSHSLGYKDGQLLLGFTHNTPDNTLPIFWNEGRHEPWTPIFLRYDKVYG